MRHLKHNRSGTLVENVRVLSSQRSVLLPPLPATAWVQRRSNIITTKIVVNKNKPNDVGPELIAVGRTIDGIGTSKSTDPLLRISQLEQNIRFLQEQHQQMLTGLHEEIDSLRQKNRDLHFQLVFSKGYVAPSSSASTPEDEQKTRVLSPKQVNVTPLQIELLEREIGDLKIQLQDVNTRNTYLTAIVDEQKKKLEQKEQEEKTQAQDGELASKLEEVEVVVRKIRRENDDLRREITELRTGYNASNHSSNNHGGNRGGRYRGNNQYRGHNRFPPLHTQSFWQGGRSLDIDTETSATGNSLPRLNANIQGQGQSSSSSGGSQQLDQQHYTGGRRGNNRYHQGQQSERKYRGNRGHKS